MFVGRVGAGASGTDSAGDFNVRRRSTQRDDPGRLPPPAAAGPAAVETVDDTAPFEVDTYPRRSRASLESGRRPSLTARVKRKRSDEDLSAVATPSSSSSSSSVSAPDAQAHPSTVTAQASRPSEGPDHAPRRPSPTPSSIPVRLAQTRNRGLSLRSSLFTQNINKSLQQTSPVLELQPTSSFRNTSRSEPSTKKNVEPSVTVAAVKDQAVAVSSPPTHSIPVHNHSIVRSRHASNDSSPTRGVRRDRPSSGAVKLYRRLYRSIFRVQDIPPSPNGRRITFDIGRDRPIIDERTGAPFIGNSIRSSKYTIWTFLPLQVFAQFSRLANFYFLTISLLQLVPGLSTTGNFTTMLPLLFFVSLSMAKEGLEDVRRHRLDKAENDCTTHVLRRSDVSTRRKLSSVALEEGGHPLGTEYVPIKWRAIQVGDVVRLKRDDPAPADLVLISSAGPNNVAYVETMALDGETSLKSKQPPANFTSTSASTCATSFAGAELVVEDPNLDLYNFEGKVTIQDRTCPLTNNEIIYRGSVIRNTPEVLGLVIYTGEECKIRMNANQHVRVKAPSMQSVVNRIVMIIITFVLFLALYNTTAAEKWQNGMRKKAWYIKHAHVRVQQLFFSFVFMFNTLIPLSLYIDMEIIKLAQILLMTSDMDMYDEASNIPCEPRTSTINEELGQVGYVFSDKTGTLTENVMLFRKISVAGQAWVHESADGEAAASAMSTRTMLDTLRRHPGAASSEAIKMMLLSMALCHTCLPERKTGGQDDISYQASSPDELALVQAAKELGFTLHDRDITTITLSVKHPESTSDAVFERYDILDTIEFSSQRKRMSVVVRFPDGRICIICKGADSVITERLRATKMAREKQSDVKHRADERRSLEAQEILRRKSSVAERSGSLTHFSRTSTQLQRNSMSRISISRPRATLDAWLHSPELGRHSAQFAARPSMNSEREMSENSDKNLARAEVHGKDEAAVLEHCFQHIDDFATEGLRTLMYGYRFLDENEYQTWRETYNDATTSLVERQRRIEEAGELIERQLELGGATAIEDKLQKGVPETIESLQRAEIKVWMLTGDKRETAINIGHSCRLIKDYSTVTILDCEVGGLEQTMSSAIVSINRGEIAHSVVVVDGQTLSTIELDQSLYALFTDLTILTDSVICCRASPSQKASLVHATRMRMNNAVTLAIGDGANDIAMIQEAHVGIGIAGKEGLQAARVSDYSIAQFRFLAKLLFVHGRWNYARVCKYILGTFWKEMFFFLSQAVYQRFAGYTGTSLYETWSLSEFNALFTSLVIIFLGIFEKDLDASTLIAVPELYSFGQKGHGFSFLVYARWMLLACAETMIVCWVMISLFGSVAFTKGQTLYAMGDVTFTACIVVIATKLQLIEQRNRTIMAAVAWVAGVGSWFMFTSILSKHYHNPKVPYYYVKGSFLKGFGQNVLWWLTVLLAIAACLLLEIFVKALKHAIWPNDTETFQVLETDPVLRKRFHDASELWLAASRRCPKSIFGLWNADKKTAAILQSKKNKDSTVVRSAQPHGAAAARVEVELERLRDRLEPKSPRTKDGVEMIERPTGSPGRTDKETEDIQEMLRWRFGEVRESIDDTHFAR